MRSGVADKQDSKILGQGVGSQLVLNGGKEWSERVRALLLAQPLNPLSPASFRPYEKETAIAV